MQDEFQVLLDQDKVDDLSRMYGLLSRLPDLEKLRSLFETHVRKQGTAAVEKVGESPGTGEADDEDEDEVPVPTKKAGKAGPEKRGPDVNHEVYVQALLGVHGKYSGLVQTAFKGDAGFVASLDRACREFVNRNAVCVTTSTKTPELLAKYCDQLLKKSNKSSDETDIDAQLNKVVRISYCGLLDRFLTRLSQLADDRLQIR